MSLEVTPYAEKRRQPTVAVVAGTPERLRYITSDGIAREGEPESLWSELSQRERYTATYSDKGTERLHFRTGAPPIVIAAKRGSIRDLVRTCDARHWLGLRSTHGKYKTLVHDGGPTVRRLGITADLEPAATGLFTFVDFLNTHGVRFSGSIAAAGLSLFRTTLTEPLRFWAPPLALEALWPGRREYWHEPRQWRQMQYYDIQAAYPSALRDGGIPTHWHQIDPSKWRNNPNGFSAARAFTPYDNVPPNPLPMRLRPGTRRESISWASGAFHGVWPHLDMMPVPEVGGWIEADETWAPTRYTDAFSSDKWQELRQEMRALPGLAGVLGKLADNGLWGMFAFDNSADIEVRWQQRNGDMAAINERVKVEYGEPTESVLLYALLLGYVKSLWDGIASTCAIYCDTDGIIAPATSVPKPYAAGEGSWLRKQAFRLLEIKAPQTYRWANLTDTDWRYLGECSPRHFLGADVDPRRANGDGMGTAPPMSVKQAYLRGLMRDNA